MELSAYWGMVEELREYEFFNNNFLIGEMPIHISATMGAI
jgi:hypothetical protein